MFPRGCGRFCGRSQRPSRAPRQESRRDPRDRPRIRTRAEWAGLGVSMRFPPTGATARELRRSTRRNPGRGFRFQSLAGGFPGDRNGRGALRGRPLHHPIARRKTGVFRHPIGWSPFPVSLSLHGGGDAAAAFLPCASARVRGNMSRSSQLNLEAVVGIVRFRPHERSITPNFPIVHDLFLIAPEPGRWTAVAAIGGAASQGARGGRPPLDPCAPARSQGQTAAGRHVAPTPCRSSRQASA